MRFVWLLILLLPLVRAVPIRQIETTIGARRTVILHDLARPFPPYVVRTHTEGTTDYAVAVDAGITEHLVCERVSVKIELTTPRGCDATSATEARVDYFCEFGGDLAMFNAAERVRAQWFLSPDSPYCTDKSACFGPLYLTTEGWSPADPITDVDLLRSTSGVYLRSVAGPAGEIPMITYVRMQMPKLALYSNCTGYEEIEFSLSANDNDEGAYTNSTYVYGSGIVRRLRFERSSRNKFRIKLGNKGGSATFYQDAYQSVNEYDGVESVVNTRVAFVDVNSTATCASELILIPAPRDFKLIDPVAPDGLEYYLDNRGAYVTSECGYRACSLDIVNDLVQPNCPLGAVLGGRVSFTSPGPFGIKYRVEPDVKYKDFEWSCVKFYPRGGTFDISSGATINAYAPETFTCNVPFPFPRRIEEKDNDVAEKLRQCRMLGGYAALTTKSYCTIPVETTLCRRGWFYFDGYCYYRPDPDRDARFKSRQDDADDVCSSIHPKARAAASIDAYTESWLQTNFVFHLPIACGTSPVRARVTGTRCKCYDCPSVINSTVLDGTVRECGCETPEFPLCFYKIRDDYIDWNDMKFHPATLQILRDGQCMDSQPDDPRCMGFERYGLELTCDCFPGNGRHDCQGRVCIVNASTLTGDYALLKFAQACEVHGYCDEAQVDTCACLPNYGPPSTFGQDEFNAIPCLFPMTKTPRDPSAGFIANGTFYDAPLGVCNGASAGEGVCDPATKICSCVCKQSVNMDPDGEPFEPAYDGIGCTASVPRLPADGFQINGGIVERLCNGKGTACPYGERLGMLRLDGTYIVITDSDLCRNQPEKCVCDNGMAGEECTVPVPYDETASKPTFGEYGAYVPIRGGRNPIMNVFVGADEGYPGIDPACDVTNVYLSDTVFKSDTNCTKAEEKHRWWCAGAYGTYVVISTTQRRPSCFIRAYIENDLPCGNFTNPYVGRMFANSVYRDFNRTDEFQSMKWTRYGGSKTECGCDADHTGAMCRSETSSYRVDPDGTVSKRECGGTTFPPRGMVGTDGRCKCSVIAGNDFAGSKACACPITPDGNRCGGVCKCRDPVFPPGRCEFDMNAERDDVLSTPFTQVTPPDAVRNITYVVMRNENETHAIMEFEGRSWIVNEGQTLSIETAKGNISVLTYDNARFPLNITHECGQPEGVVGPMRAIANVSVHTQTCVEYEGCTTESYQTMCDPAFSCPTRVRCGYTYPCIEIHSWTEDPDDADDVLPSRRYVNARITRGVLMPTKTQVDTEFPYGVFPTCADPVYRWLDAGLVGAGMVSQRQCVSGFGPHDNTKGQVYGVFDNVIPGLNFRLTNWTTDHYAFIASVMNDKVCVDTEAQDYVHDALTDAVMDKYLYTLVRAAGEETEVELGAWGSGTALQGGWNATRETTDVPAWWGNAFWHPDTTLPFGPETRWGGYVFLPKGSGEVRRVTIRNGGNETWTSFALIGPRGETCLTYLKPFAPNETLTVDCGASFESESYYTSMRRLWDLNLTHLAPNVTEWISSYVMLYSAPGPVTVRDSDVGYTSRTESYVDLWRSYSASIISERVFPHNAPYETECVRLGGTLRDVNLSSENDLKHLFHVRSGHLAPFTCTHNWQCKRFAKDKTAYRCVPDPNFPSEGYLNGDPTTGDDGVVGIEGGCDCRGIRELMDPQFYGYQCTSGYDATWTSLLKYEARLLEILRESANWTEPFVLVNMTQWMDGTPKCVLPSASSTGRLTTACGGGRGRIERDTYERTGNITVYNGNKVKKCAFVRVRETGELLQAHENELELDIHSFGNYRLNIVQGRAFLDGVELLVAKDELECVSRTYSATHRVLSYVDGASYALTKRDEWTDFLILT